MLHFLRVCCNVWDCNIVSTPLPASRTTPVGWAVCGAPAASVMRCGLSDDTLPAERRIQPDILVRIAGGRLCVCRASMCTLLAGDTHARPPVGRTSVHHHVVLYATVSVLR